MTQASVPSRRLKVAAARVALGSNRTRRLAFGASLSAGFTLIEILVTLGIITLVAALGVPVFNALSGARSTEAGRNLVAAALGQARTIAVNEGRYTGVLFYVDPATERTAMSIVSVNDPQASYEDADPYDKYKSWIPGQQYNTGEIDTATSRVTRSDRVISLASDSDATFLASDYPAATPSTEYLKFFGNYRPTVRIYRCKEQHTSANSSGNRPPRTGPNIAPDVQFVTYPTPNAIAPPPSETTYLNFSNRYWGRSAPLVSTAKQLLPKGVGLQVIVPPIATTTANQPEQYLRTACIVFDPQGRMVTQPFSIPSNSDLGKDLGLTTDPAVIAQLRTRGLSPDAEIVYAGLGVILYDQQLFRSQNFSESDWIYQNRDNNDAVIFSDQGAVFGDYPRDAPNANATFDISAASTISERAEETWLQNNAVPLLINRFSGSLTETE
jgi:prepilin-type N-terminal cleavage/methylation domain-containing protein